MEFKMSRIVDQNPVHMQQLTKVNPGFQWYSYKKKKVSTIK